MFYYKINWINDTTEKSEVKIGVCKGKSFTDAINSLSTWYGEDNIISIIGLWELDIVIEREDIGDILLE